MDLSCSSFSSSTSSPIGQSTCSGYLCKEPHDSIVDTGSSSPLSSTINTINHNDAPFSSHLPFSIDSLLSNNGDPLRFNPPVNVTCGSTLNSLQSLFHDGFIPFNPTINLRRSDAADYSMSSHVDLQDQNITPFSSNQASIGDIPLETLMSRMILQNHLAKCYQFSCPPKFSQEILTNASITSYPLLSASLANRSSSHISLSKATQLKSSPISNNKNNINDISNISSPSKMNGTNLNCKMMNGSICKKRRSWRRAVFSSSQREKLEQSFLAQNYINKTERSKLAFELGLSDEQIKVWFQNRRMKKRNLENDGTKIGIRTKSPQLFNLKTTLNRA
ncbi:uncharacterized protein LOC141855785 [Brevipalpus obovatus]|uniref:uncharacterized protein LOC141855785 n=1 Tax=Brevipalpus obovatus TaxID=246614 RepID=UPI003D9F8678